MSIESQITRIQNEVITQTDLISQIANALEGKAAGVTLPTLTNPGVESDLMIDKELIDGEGKVIRGTYIPLDTSDATATANDIVNGATAYVNGNKIIGVHECPEADEPVLQEKTVTPSKTAQEVLSDTGYEGLSKVTVEKIPDEYQDVSGVTAGAGDVLTGKKFVNASGDTITGSIPMLAGRVITPGATNQTIPGGSYLNDDLVIQGEADLRPEYIKEGISMFGVVGTYSGESSSDATLYDLTIIADNVTIVVYYYGGYTTEMKTISANSQVTISCSANSLIYVRGNSTELYEYSNVYFLDMTSSFDTYGGFGIFLLRVNGSGATVSFCDAESGEDDL